MSFRVVFHPEAADEMRMAEKFINERRRGWGAKFRAEVVSALDLVRSRPGGQVQRSGRYWRVHVERFPYRLYYLVERNEILVYAVYHSSRKDGGWKRRKFE